MSVCEGIRALQLVPDPVGLELGARTLFGVPAPGQAAGTDPLAGDRAQDSKTVAESPQVALAVDSGRLVARDLDDLEAGGEGADVHQRLDLEAVRVSLDHRSNPLAPEGVVAVAEVRVVAAESQPHQHPQAPVAKPAERAHVGSPAALEEAGPLGEIGAGEKRPDEGGDLLRQGGAVGVQGDDDVAARGAPSSLEGGALAADEVLDDAELRDQGARELHGPVDREAVDEDNLVDPARNARQD